MLLLRYYIIGELICFFFSLLMEHLYFSDGKAECVTIKNIGADFLFSFLSWIGVIGLVFLFITEWYCGFDQRGIQKSLHDYEEKLKEEERKQKNADKKD